VNLLFQMDSDDFGEEIYSKPYPKYVYKSPKIGPKIDRKEAFFKAINGASTEHLYSLNPLNRRNFCYFCQKNSSKLVKKENIFNSLNSLILKQREGGLKERIALNIKRYRGK
jgi:hypothetical protein